MFGTIILLYFTLSSSLTESMGRKIRCPLSCKCDPDTYNPHEMGVTCEDKRIWTKLPTLPMNTTYLRMKNSNMAVLRGSSHSNVEGRLLHKLIMMNMNISSLDVGAFQNLNQLEGLILPFNKLQRIPNETFRNIPDLLELSLGDNRFRTIPVENICLLKQLQSLNISGNSLTNATFEECFIHLRNLTMVAISSNPIKKINPKDFYSLRFSKISTLYLRQLGLTKLPVNVFMYFYHLKVLNIEMNELMDLQPDMFKFVTGLTSLQVGRNNLTQLPNLTGLNQLQDLSLERNNIKNSIFGPEFFNMTRLTNLILSGNNLGSLSNESFLNINSSAELTKLDLYHCKLNSIEPDAFLPLRSLNYLSLNKNYMSATMLQQAFYGLRFTVNLTTLDISNNRLVDLSNQTFQHLANVTVTHLTAMYCNIGAIKSNAFRYLPSLQHLNLRSSRIKEIQPNAFSYLKELVYLDLSRNRLDAIPKGNLAKLGNVRHLMLSRNNIGNSGQLIPNSFLGYDKVEELNLQSNKIRTITSNVFIHAPNIRSLTLNFNELRTITRLAFAGLKQLEELSLEHNNIYEIDVDTFQQTPTILRLDLSFNNALSSAIQGNIVGLLAPLRKLTYLQLTALGFSNIPNEMLHNLTQLSVFTMSSNHLPNLDPDLLRDQSNLTVLTLKRNNIASITEDSIGHLSKLQQLDVSNNSFRCDCDLQWFTNWIRSGTVYVRDLQKVRCISPSSKAGLLLENVYLDRECMPLLLYYVYWSLLACYAFTVICFTMTYRLRWYIKYWMHLVRARKAMEREMAEGHYVFDAFVSYTHQDKSWVIHELLPRIEYEAKIRLCLHQRNWLAGRSIARNITDSIEKSRKTVLVLSNAYAQSYWCELELTMAQHKLLTSSRYTGNLQKR